MEPSSFLEGCGNLYRWTDAWFRSHLCSGRNVRSNRSKIVYMKYVHWYRINEVGCSICHRRMPLELYLQPISREKQAVVSFWLLFLLLKFVVMVLFSRTDRVLCASPKTSSLALWHSGSPNTFWNPQEISAELKRKQCRRELTHGAHELWYQMHSFVWPKLFRARSLSRLSRVYSIHEPRWSFRLGYISLPIAAFGKHFHRVASHVNRFGINEWRVSDT